MDVEHPPALSEENTHQGGLHSPRRSRSGTVPAGLTFGVLEGLRGQSCGLLLLLPVILSSNSQCLWLLPAPVLSWLLSLLQACCRGHGLQGDKYSTCQTEERGQEGATVMKDTHSNAFQKQNEPLLRFQSCGKSDPKVALPDQDCP